MVNDTVDTGGDDGIQVYSWSNTKIVCGVPKGNGGNYVTAGEIPVAVTAASQGSASVNITIKPKIYAVKPTAGAAGTLVTIEGTAFSATPAGNSVSFHGMTTAASSFIRGTGNDTIEVYVPARATTGALSVTVNSQASNTNYDWGTQEPVTFTINGASINLTYDANRGNVFWIAIPYSTPSVKAADLLAEINTQAGQAAGSGALVTSIGRWKGGANPQVFETYDYLAALDSWSGSNFDLVPGEAVYVNIAQSVSFTLSGGHNPNTTLSFPYDASRGNVFWVSLPYSGDYADAAAVVADINTQSGQAAGSGALVTSIGRWNGTANPQVFETYDYLDALDSWSGSNFKFTPGEGYYLNIAQNINSWRPKTK
jgi:hypothetical protein